MPGIMAHIFDYSSWRGRVRWMSEFQDSLVSIVSSRTVSYIERACLKQTPAGPWKEQATPRCEE